ncbi:MAG: phosphodiesterase [bacterium]
MLIAQLTDLHLTDEDQPAYNVVDTVSPLKRAVAHLNELNPRPDFCVVTGDIADDGSMHAYERAREILGKLVMDWVVLPGNHDHKASLVKTLLSGIDWVQPAEDRICWSLPLGHIRLLALDTTIPGCHQGGLDLPMLRWLENELDVHRNFPMILCMHHPPFPIGIGHMDRTPMTGAEKLAALLSESPNVIRILAGHAHRPIVGEFGGSLVSVAPSTAMQLALDLRPQAPSEFVLEPSGFALHLWHKDWTGKPSLLTHFGVLNGGDHLFSGPHPFFDLVLPK